jgi:hypothetical protein
MSEIEQAPERGAAAIEVDDLVAMRRALHELVASSPMSTATMERLAGLPAGYISKVLNERPLRGLTGNTIFLLSAVLGRKVVLIADPAAEARVKAHHAYVVCTARAQRRGPHHWRTAGALALVSRWGREGMKKRLAAMAPEAFREHQSRAAKKKWRAFRRARRARRATVEPQLGT